MAFHKIYGATVVVAAFGLVTVDPAYAQARRDGNLLPQAQSGQVTAVGCLVKGDTIRGGKADKYVLARVKKGPIASVPEASCTAESGADALTVDNPEKASMKDSMLGKWVEITGRLEKETDKNPDNLRHHVRQHPRRRWQNRGHSRRRLRQLPRPQRRNTCRRRQASFQRLASRECWPLQQASCFVRRVSVSGRKTPHGSRDIKTDGYTFRDEGRPTFRFRTQDGIAPLLSAAIF